MTPQERQKIFEDLSPAAAVAFWQTANEEVRRSLAFAMHQQYWKFVESQVKKGVTIKTQNEEDGKLWVQINEANEEVMELGRRPASPADAKRS